MLTVFTNILKDFPLSLSNSWLSGMDRGKNRKVNMLEVENVRYGVNLLKNRALRQLEAIRSLTRVLLEANDLPEQIEKLKSRESKLKIIKEDIKIIRSLPEPEARQKLLQVEMDLEECKQQLSEVRQQQSEVRQQQSEVREKTKKLDGIFLNNEEFSTETLEKELYSAVPCMKEVAATYDHARLPSSAALPPTSSDLDFQIYENDKGLHGIPLGNTITNGTLQQGGSEASEAQYNKNAPPLSHSDGEMGKDPFKMVEPNWSAHRDNGDIIMIPTPGAPNGANGQPLPPDDIQVNCSSSMLTGGKKRNQKAKGKGIKKQCRPQVTGESSNLGQDNSEELIWGYNEETSKNKFYSAVPSMQDVAPTDCRESSSTFGDMDIPICGIDKGPHGIPLGNTITSGMLQQGGSEASEAQYNTNTPPLSHSDNQMNLMLSGSNKRDGISEAGVQGTEMNDVTIRLLAREMLKCNYSSWQSGLFNKDNNSVEVAHFHGLQEALDETHYGETPDYLKLTKFGHKNIEVLVCAAIKQMEDWRTPKDSGCNQLKKWAATLNMGKEQDFEVKFADDMLNNICLACYAYSMIYGEDGSVHKVASGRV
ncbi:uncharacterized protein LOC105761735 [Gossypium raimondii]|uniref:uncharacterized protein LOC105761735 n=1 Tax=Gossypium raimondii TaxID=29730 RepID=UPI00227C0ABA|nr:uncharacterized protein LOC105761735 [Gossypium raimondii]